MAFGFGKPKDQTSHDEGLFLDESLTNAVDENVSPTLSSVPLCPLCHYEKLFCTYCFVYYCCVCERPHVATAPDGSTYWACDNF